MTFIGAVAINCNSFWGSSADVYNVSSTPLHLNDACIAEALECSLRRQWGIIQGGVEDTAVKSIIGSST